MSSDKVVVEEVQVDSDDEIPALENEATAGNIAASEEEEVKHRHIVAFPSPLENHPHIIRLLYLHKSVA
jgi:hypothetical protein